MSRKQKRMTDFAILFFKAVIVCLLNDSKQ